MDVERDGNKVVITCDGEDMAKSVEKDIRKSFKRLDKLEKFKKLKGKFRPK